MSWYPSPPKKTHGGIKAQSQRGSFAHKWWGKRWLSILDNFHVGQRLSRGRSYARHGQVTSIHIDKGKVKATVQGSRSKPYKITITINTLQENEWQKIIARLSAQAIYAAKLLIGEMPEDIEEVFNEVGLSLFPQKKNDLNIECSCPDWANPCKHIAAVYYLLAEEFDRNPFLLFQLRGKNQEELLALLAGSKIKVREKPDKSQPVADDIVGFWKKDKLQQLAIECHTPPLNAALLKGLGNFPLWQGKGDFLKELEKTYSQASQNAMEISLLLSSFEHPKIRIKDGDHS